MKQKLIISLMLSFVLASCHNKHYDLVSTTTRKVSFTDNAYLKVKVFNNSDCNISCKQKLTYVALNENDFPIEANFEKTFRFASHDSVVNQKNILKPGDSVVIACGCEGTLDRESFDWNMDLKIISVIK